MGKIETVGIVGFGVMGAAIGLNAASSGYRVIYKELNDELVRSMYDRWVKSALEKRVAKGKMTRQEMDHVAGMISGTSSYQDLASCDLVIEAAVEKMDLKIQIFKDLDAVCRPDAIIVSNTSTFLIERLMASVSNPSRTAGLHYFFPANINRLVEVIRQKATSDETFTALMAFAEKNRKVPIAVKDFPGFAINPVFISSYMMLDSFYGDEYNVATLERISQLALNVRFGIMWVQNGSGLGTCYHAAVSMNDYLADTDVGYPAVPDQLKNQFESGQTWNLEDGPVAGDPALLNVVKDRLLGSIFTISNHLIEKKVVSMKDLELGICTSLAWPKGPFAMMNALGMKESARLVALTVASGEFKMPKTFAERIPLPWDL
ncbi:3-hydroxyacyl-CoA dehydrogenase family protein [uncultured Desulfosarcina sp.]|uniref:3-hydroxyacyl-CoA dehydrogenase family protein n=1 Tax=uncultured Desulfosarcina sp. TaxID=218289 RepID=UPI0029C861F0|nr:3-hydroxyacyl-CoA dehydrogenase family protein [uncultured Desulfosarcina sp.]